MFFTYLGSLIRKQSICYVLLMSGIAFHTFTGEPKRDGLNLEEFEFESVNLKKFTSRRAFLQYGSLVSSAVTCVSSIYCTKLVRSLLNIGSYARVYPFCMTTVVPTIMSGMWTEKGVTENTLLMSVKCPICLHMRFGFIQTMFGFVFPVFASVAIHLPVAHHYRTTSLPNMNDAMETLKFCKNILKTRALQFKIVAALQIPLVFLLPYLQAKQLDNINRILRLENSKEVENFDL